MIAYTSTFLGPFDNEIAISEAFQCEESLFKKVCNSLCR